MRIEPTITAPEAGEPVTEASAAAAPTGPATAGLRPDGPEIRVGAAPLSDCERSPAGQRGMTPITTYIDRLFFRAIAEVAGVAAIVALAVLVLTGEALALVIMVLTGFAAYAFDLASREPAWLSYPPKTGQ